MNRKQSDEKALEIFQSLGLHRYWYFVAARNKVMPLTMDISTILLTWNESEDSYEFVFKPLHFRLGKKDCQLSKLFIGRLHQTKTEALKHGILYCSQQLRIYRQMQKQSGRFWLDFIAGESASIYNLKRLVEQETGESWVFMRNNKLVDIADEWNRFMPSSKFFETESKKLYAKI